MKTQTMPKPKPLSFATREKHRMQREYSLLLDFLLARGGTPFMEGETRLELPLPVNVANARLHWRSKDTLRQAYFAHCDTLLRAGVEALPPVVPTAYAAIRIELHCKREMDTDNAVARFKWAGDWLQERGYIQSDKPARLRWDAMPTQFPKATVPRLVIFLREVSP
jgi:hypothetical protein